MITLLSLIGLDLICHFSQIIPKIEKYKYHQRDTVDVLTTHTDEFEKGQKKTKSLSGRATLLQNQITL